MEKLASEEVYIDECAYVTIEIENLKNLYFEDVIVNETIPENLVLDPDMDVDWTFDFKNNSKKLHSYSLTLVEKSPFRKMGDERRTIRIQH